MVKNSNPFLQSPAYAKSLQETANSRKSTAICFSSISGIFLVIALLTQSSFRGLLSLVFSNAWASVTFVWGSLRGGLSVFSEHPVALSSFTVIVISMATAFLHSRESLVSSIAKEYAEKGALAGANLEQVNQWIQSNIRGFKWVCRGIWLLAALNAVVIFSEESLLPAIFEGPHFLGVLAMLFAGGFQSCLGQTLKGDFSLASQVIRNKLKMVAPCNENGHAVNLEVAKDWLLRADGLEYIRTFVDAGLLSPETKEGAFALRRVFVTTVHYAMTEEAGEEVVEAVAAITRKLKAMPAAEPATE